MVDFLKLLSGVRRGACPWGLYRDLSLDSTIQIPPDNTLIEMSASRRTDCVTPFTVLSQATKMSNLLLVLLLQRAKRQRTITFRHRLNAEGRRRRDRRITRSALQHPFTSPFAVLFGSGCDQSLITFCGFDHACFRYLLPLFEPLYLRLTPYRSNGFIRVILRRRTQKGRTWSLSAV